MKITKKMDVTIDVNGNECGNCMFIEHRLSYCNLYEEEIEWKNTLESYKWYRCKKCIKDFGNK